MKCNCWSIHELYPQTTKCIFQATWYWWNVYIFDVFIPNFPSYFVDIWETNQCMSTGCCFIPPQISPVFLFSDLVRLLMILNSMLVLLAFGMSFLLIWKNLHLSLCLSSWLKCICFLNSSCKIWALFLLIIAKYKYLFAFSGTLVLGCNRMHQRHFDQPYTNVTVHTNIFCTIRILHQSANLQTLLEISLCASIDHTSQTISCLTVWKTLQIVFI